MFDKVKYLANKSKKVARKVMFRPSEKPSVTMRGNVKTLRDKARNLRRKAASLHGKVGSKAAIRDLEGEAMTLEATADMIIRKHSEKA